MQLQKKAEISHQNYTVNSKKTIPSLIGQIPFLGSAKKNNGITLPRELMKVSWWHEGV